MSCESAAALAEALVGAAKGTKTSVMITLGTGVGGGIIIDGKIFAGGINFHGRYEFVPIPSMEKATQVIVNIARLVAEGK